MNSQWSDQLTGAEDVTGDHVQSAQADGFAEETSIAEHRPILIRKQCVDFSTRTRRALNHSRTLLTKQLIRTKRDFHTGAVSDDSAIKSLQNALSALVLQEAEGAKIRSRPQWIKEGEKPTRYFFRLENKRAAKNSCFSLRCKWC